MSPWKAARTGDLVSDIDTPALVLDLNVFERNLECMAEALEGSGVRLRAHAKSHKTPEVALRQIDMGASGICCQKVSEAAVFVEAGIEDVLVTNEVVGILKLRRLATLARKARMGVLVDHELHIQALLDVMRSEGVTLDVYIEVDVGANRCGVAPGTEAARLAQAITAGAPYLRFMGLHCYHGLAQHLRTPPARAAAIAEAVNAARLTRESIESCGIFVERVTGAGTGSFLHERDSGVFNEIQAGSYAFMDRDYADNQRGEEDIVFGHALFVLTTVMSRIVSERAVVDAGHKAASIDSGMPGVWQNPGLRYVKANDDHGILAVADAAAVSLGEKLMLLPGNCDPTMNLYDDLICIRDGRVETIWPISARGTLL